MPTESDYKSFSFLLRNGGRFESNTQRKRLQETITQSTAVDIPRIDNDISRLRADIERLELERKEIQQDVRKYQTLLAPINQLPNEVLTEVFLLHCDTTEEYITAITDGAWTLSHVSNEWRALTLALPQLWSDIYIGVIENPKKNEIELLSTALKRSGSYPLTLRAAFSWSTADEDELDIYRTPSHGSGRLPFWPSQQQLSEAMIEAVVQHSNRWKTADIELLYDCSRFLTPIHGRLSLLEKLVFGGDVGDVGDLPHYFEEAPRLRDIEFSNTDSRPFRLPWKQLTRFKESQWNPSTDLFPRYLGILRKYPQLEEFAVQYDSASQNPQHRTANSRMTLPQLKVFSSTDPLLIGSVTLPNLHTLRLEPLYRCDCPPDTIPAVRNLLLRSGCAANLRFLELHNVVLNKTIFSLLETTSGLTELNLTFEKWSSSIDYFMKALVKRLSTYEKKKEQLKQVLLPKLESFTIDVEPLGGWEWFTCDIGFVDGEFVDMIQSRWNNPSSGISQIKVVKFEGYTPATLNAFVAGDGLERMRKMRDEGLETYIATMAIDCTDDDRRETTYLK